MFDKNVSFNQFRFRLKVANSKILLRALFVPPILVLNIINIVAFDLY